MSDFNSIFDSLLDAGVVSLNIDARQAEILRSSLVRRWSKYKTSLDALGFLAEEQAVLGVRMEKVEDSNKLVIGYKYCLTRRRGVVNYQILEIDNSNSTKEEDNGNR